MITAILVMDGSWSRLTRLRYLRFRGFDVTYVRNITDVDDKIFERAAERKIPFTELTAEMIGAMHQDEERLVSGA